MHRADIVIPQRSGDYKMLYGSLCEPLRPRLKVRLPGFFLGDMCDEGKMWGGCSSEDL